MKFLLMALLFSTSLFASEINYYGNYYDPDFSMENVIKADVPEYIECIARSGETLYSGVHQVEETARFVAITRCGYLSETPDSCVFVECKPYIFQN